MGLLQRITNVVHNELLCAYEQFITELHLVGLLNPNACLSEAARARARISLKASGIYAEDARLQASRQAALVRHVSGVNEDGAEMASNTPCCKEAANGRQGQEGEVQESDDDLSRRFTPAETESKTPHSAFRQQGPPSKDGLAAFARRTSKPQRRRKAAVQKLRKAAGQKPRSVPRQYRLRKTQPTGQNRQQKAQPAKQLPSTLGKRKSAPGTSGGRATKRGNWTEDVEEIQFDLWNVVKRVEMFLQENTHRRLGTGPTPDTTAATLKDLYEAVRCGMPVRYQLNISLMVASLYAACQDACCGYPIPVPVAQSLHLLWLFGLPEWGLVDGSDLGPFCLVAAFFNGHAPAAFDLAIVQNAVMQQFCFATIAERDIAQGALLFLLKAAQTRWGDDLVLPGSVGSALLHLFDRVATTTVFYSAPPEEDSEGALQMVVV